MPVAQLIGSRLRRRVVDFTVFIILFIVEGLSRKQHYNCFSEECRFIYLFFSWYVCVFAPCAFTEMGSSPFPQSVWLLFSSSNFTADPTTKWNLNEDTLESNFLSCDQQLHLFGQRSLVEVSVSVRDASQICFMFNKRFKCAISRAWDTETKYCILLHYKPHSTCLNVYFLERIGKRFFPKSSCNYIWKSKCMIFKFLQV